MRCPDAPATLGTRHSALGTDTGTDTDTDTDTGTPHQHQNEHEHEHEHRSQLKTTRPSENPSP